LPMVAKSKTKIAFVEDSPDSAQLFTTFLNEYCDDFEVCYFSNGPEFLEALGPGIYRIAILDISLPGMDGYELIQKMHAVDPRITAVAFTAHADERYRQRAIDVGFHSVVTKPVHDLDAFCRMIVDLADRAAA
jgi:two-component system, NtrC family, C4-dicarboxylate transport response regulator DctD